MTREHHIQTLVARLGETDQQFLSDPTPHLALARAEVRMALVRFSSRKDEQLYLLNEAAVIVELALTEVDERDLHEQLSIQLASVYLQHYEVTRETRYLVVTGQILRVHTTHAHPSVYMGLARADAGQGKPALTRHWLTLWLQALQPSVQADRLPATVLHGQLSGLTRHAEFASLLHEAWFTEIINQAGQVLVECLPTPASPVHS